MPNTLDKEALEAAFPHLLNFRKWTRTTDELTDHDLLVTANHIVSDFLAALDGRVVVERECLLHGELEMHCLECEGTPGCYHGKPVQHEWCPGGERIVIWEEDEEDED